MPGHSHEIACLGREITRVGFETWVALRHAFFSLFDVGGPSGPEGVLDLSDLHFGPGPGGATKQQRLYRQFQA